MNERTGLSLDEALEQKKINAKQYEYWNKYTEKLNSDRYRKTVEYINLITLEKAKRLSVSKEFHSRIIDFRNKWSIRPSTQYQDVFIEAIRKDHVLSYFAFGRKPTQEEWEELQQDLERYIFEPLSLDWVKDSGLVVAAICFGITRENVIHHWEEIAVIATQGAYPWSDIVIDNSRERLQQHVGSVLTICYLAARIQGEASSEASFPAPIQQWVDYALNALESGDLAIRPDDIPDLLDNLGIRPKNPEYKDDEVLLRINADTLEADLKRSWPFVEVMKLETYDQNQIRPRSWDTYERDTFIWKRHYKDGLTFDAAYEEWLTLHPDERRNPTYLNSIIKAMEKIETL